MEQQRNTRFSLTASITNGVVAGLVGGAVFGVQMMVAGMLPMVASLIGSDSVVVGFILHMIISAVIGVSYALVAPRLPQRWPIAIGGGIVLGIVWWILGALIIMPAMLGGNVLAVGDMQLGSLVGHIIFGIVTAAFFTLITERQ
ncbi:MAG: DUF1440 domain-containing protein [Chloroflexi bacterium]|nr:DUF1440 domain-containing protein [Chloroflexota bacterium]